MPTSFIAAAVIAALLTLLLTATASMIRRADPAGQGIALGFGMLTLLGLTAALICALVFAKPLIAPWIARTAIAGIVVVAISGFIALSYLSEHYSPLAILALIIPTPLLLAALTTALL